MSFNSDEREWSGRGRGGKQDLSSHAFQGVFLLPLLSLLYSLPPSPSSFLPSCLVFLFISLVAVKYTGHKVHHLNHF